MRVQRRFLLGLVGALAALAVPAPAASASAQTSPPVTPTTVPCGVRTLSEVSLSSGSSPATDGPNTVVSPNVSITDFAVQGSQLSVLTGNTILQYSLTGTSTGTIHLPAGQIVQSLAVDDQGDSYVGISPNVVDKLSPTGAVLWSHQVGQQITALWSSGAGAAYRLGVVSRGAAGSAVYDAAGNSTGTSAVTGTVITETGGVVYADDLEYVRAYRNGALSQTVGDPHMQNDPQPQGAPWHFYQQGGAVPASDGSILVADGSRGIDELTPQGYYRGLAPDAQLGMISQQSRLLVVGGQVWYVGGGRNNSQQKIYRIPMAALLAMANAPAAPSYVLGPGAGITTGQGANIIPVGHQPDLTATFDPWWQNVAAGLRLSYTLQNSYDATDGVIPTATVVPLPTTPTALANIPLTLPTIGPGAYQLDARLVNKQNASVGATCLYFTVASPVDQFNLATLPPGADSGGPQPAREVALAGELGTGGARITIDWTHLLPGGASSTAPESFSYYDGQFQQAAALAVKDHVSWWVQAGSVQPGGIPQALIANGTWGKRVAELVTHFKGIVPAWEAFNEPNNNLYSAEQYVNDVLKPFSQAVRASDPAAKVIGGSTLDVSLPYWQQIAAAGGLSLMDVVGVHPYTGHNRSWEEQGIVPDLKSLQTMVGKLPIWDTESAWWGDGPANIFSQADKAARAAIWMRTLGMGPWNYFLIEGAYGDFGYSYSLIQSDSAVDNYAKPAALAMQQESGQLSGRPYLGMVNTGIPHAYAAHFGPSKGGNTDILATWTDDAVIPAQLSVAKSAQVTATDEYGAVRQQSMAAGSPLELTLRPSVSYLSYPSGAGLTIAPTETYGSDLALDGSASASSAVPSNPAKLVIAGSDNADDIGDLPAVRVWSSATGDKTPSLTVTLATPQMINRVDVLGSSMADVIPGLRDYDVDVSSGGSFSTVASVRDDITLRTHQLDFTPVMASTIRLRVLRIGTTGFAGGDAPWFKPPLEAAILYALEAYGGSASAATLQGTTLKPFAPSPDDASGGGGYAGSTGPSGAATTPSGGPKATQAAGTSGTTNNRRMVALGGFVLVAGLVFLALIVGFRLRRATSGGHRAGT